VKTANLATPSAYDANKNAAYKTIYFTDLFSIRKESSFIQFNHAKRIVKVRALARTFPFAF
jgi:hypothetical protein